MKIIKGFRGKLLKVNLSSKEITSEPLNEEIAKNFLGGAGYACRYLYNLIDKDTDPLSPDNILMIMNGPLIGTLAPNTGRWVICAKSPYTRIWGESNCGSYFGAEIKKAGYDGIIITGASKKPVYLSIKDNITEIKDADFLWGKGTYYTIDKLKETFGDTKAYVACIGSAGENLVKFANVISEERAAGRTGMGAIMGSKKLKAIIVKGSNPNVDVANPDKMKEAVRIARDQVKSSFMTTVMNSLGTSSGVDMWNDGGELPIKYWSQSNWADSSKISGSTMAESILVGNRFCHSCVIGCGRRVAIKEGKYQTEETEGPEYETIAGYGSMILNDNLESIVHVNTKCTDYGIDTISSSSAIGCVFHHYNLGNIKSEDLDGLKPEWGNIDVAEELLEKTVHREGIGNLIAEGSDAIGKKFNIPQDEIATVDGLEVTYHDLRSCYGMAIAYGIGPRGPSHNACDMMSVLLGMPLEEIGVNNIDKYLDNEEMAKISSLVMDYRALYSSMLMCSFSNPLPSQNAALIENAVGLKFGIEEVKLYGERILNMKRLFNIKMGLTAADDRLPKILLRPFPDGGSAGKTPNFEQLKKFFYEFRDWDPKTGKPSDLKLKTLGLDNL
jgi:aldehyde:ferredoxin oxidoreductase